MARRVSCWSKVNETQPFAARAKTATKTATKTGQIPQTWESVYGSANLAAVRASADVAVQLVVLERLVLGRHHLAE